MGESGFGIRQNWILIPTLSLVMSLVALSMLHNLFKPLCKMGMIIAQGHTELLLGVNKVGSGYMWEILKKAH